MENSLSVSKEVSQSFFSSAFNSSDDIILIFDTEGAPVWINERTKAVTGYEWEELQSLSPRDLVVPEDRDRIQECLATESVHDQSKLELELKTDAGKSVPYEFRTRPFTDDEGDLLGTVTIGREISTRKERESTLTALHSAAQKIGRADDKETVYETLVDAGERILEFDLVVVDVERDGYLIQEAWKLGPDEAGYYQRTSLEDDDTFAIRAYNRQETIVVDDLRQYEITPADPEYRSVLTVPIGEFGTFQTATSEVAAFDDLDREFAEILIGHAEVKLTQLQETQTLEERTQELAQRNEQLDELMSVISHDLRNPLNTLDLSLELAEEHNEDDHFDRCYRALGRMEQLLEDLLALAREGKEINEIEVVTLSTVVDEVWRTIETEEASLVVETDQKLRADRGRLKQLLENLIQNAVDHGTQSAESNQAEVTVTVGEMADGFYVADNGPGIPPEDRDQVFETQYTTSEDGTGFGLSIVEQIVEAHGWEITVTDSEDGGAQFEITDIDSDTETP